MLLCLYYVGTWNFDGDVTSFEVSVHDIYHFFLKYFTENKNETQHYSLAPEHRGVLRFLAEEGVIGFVNPHEIEKK